MLPRSVEYYGDHQRPLSRAAEMRRIAEMDKQTGTATAARARHLDTAAGYRALIATDAKALDAAS